MSLCLDPEIFAIVSRWPTPDHPPTIQELRDNESTFFAEATKWQKENAPADSEYNVEDRMIPVDGAQNLARCLIPASSDETPTQYPLMVWFHGGGYCVGSINMDDHYLRQLCVKYRIVVVSVEYRLAPEYPFPIGHNDAYESLKWAVTNCASLNASPSLGLIVGGCSAGGNLAASVALRARDDPFFSTQPITGQLIQVPQTIHPDASIPEKYRSVSQSWTECAHAPLLSRNDLDMFNVSLKADPNDPRFSVLLAPNHAGLPPAVLQIAGADPLRDEGLAYSKALNDAGVKTKAEFYPGFPHGGHYAMPRAALSQRYYQDFEQGLGWLLQRIE
ncbi:hypothetical protein QCA50_019657 [Cerrena zonata]|uniref:Alpha/beta hydrolase fold-3 domain-containing protein n=1 Tax=Cerrena zonata TaxID=2478898 RepID=A0AAW0FDR3_9APHY